MPAVGTRTKRVFFIRHAESEWNRAMRQQWHRLPAVLLGRDHPLTPSGHEQASALQTALEAALRAAEEKATTSDAAPAGLAAAREATAVWTSPLTRALQTTLVGLLPLLQRQSPPPPHVCLRPIAREHRRWLGGRDNVGAAVGDAIFERAMGHLEKLPHPPAAAAASTMRRVGAASDVSEVQGRWWTVRSEPAARVRERAAALVAELQASTHDTLIVTSHSNFFRTLFGEFADPKSATDTAIIGGRKVPNAGVVMCTLAPDGDRPLRDCELCWQPESPLGQSHPRASRSSRKVAPA